MNEHERSRDDLIDAYLRYLRGHGEPPQLGHLCSEDETEACGLFELLDAITDMGDDLAGVGDSVVGEGRAGATSAAPSLRRTPPTSTGVRSGVRRNGGAASVGLQTASRIGPVAGARWFRPFAAVAASLCLLAGSLLLLPSRPVGALETRLLTPTCPTSSDAGAGSADDGAERVVVAAVWGARERERFEEVLRSFAERTGIDVEFATHLPEADRDIGSTLRSLIKQGCAPDVALLPQPGLLRELAGEALLRPVGPVAGDLVAQNYSPAWQELGEVEGITYGVWFKAANKSIIWYNANAFEQAGITEVPRDWEALKDVAERLRRVGIPPFSVAGHPDAAWTLTDWFENVYLRTAGRAQYEKLASGGIPWTDGSVTRALEALADVFGRSEWIAGGTGGALQTTYEGSIGKVFADPLNPEAAMVFEGDFVATDLPESAEVGVDARFFAFPAIDSSEPTVVGTATAANAVDAAGGDVAVLMTDGSPGEELLRFLATPEAAEPWVRHGGFTSPNQKVSEQAYPDGETGRAARQLAVAESLTFDLTDLLPPEFGSTPGQGMWQILREFLEDPSDVEGTAQRLEAGFRAANLGS